MPSVQECFADPALPLSSSSDACGHELMSAAVRGEEGNSPLLPMPTQSGSAFSGLSGSHSPLQHRQPMRRVEMQARPFSCLVLGQDPSLNFEGWGGGEGPVGGDFHTFFHKIFGNLQLPPLCCDMKRCPPTVVDCIQLHQSLFREWEVLLASEKRKGGCSGMRT